ncbi:MAG: VWA domain-containing protein [Chitinophagaceae bacterium]
MWRYFDFKHISFAHPQFFLLLLPVIALFLYEQFQKKQSTPFILSSLKNLKGQANNATASFLKFLRYTAYLFFIIALARPQLGNVNEVINSEGIDIVLSVDISGSMLAEDFKPNRLEAAKEVSKDFIENRLTDRIGIVIFSGESFTQCPVTSDKNILYDQLRNIKSGLLEDGTAIGMGLATAVERLKDSKVKSKIIVLLTDGVNNGGLIDPLTALEIAKAYKIRVYTIGVGTHDMANYPTQDQFGNMTMQQQEVQIDEELLKKIATETGGVYYRATSNQSLENIYKAIDKLEKTSIKMNSFKHYAEMFSLYAFIGIACIVLEQIIRYAIRRTIN